MNLRLTHLVLGAVATAALFVGCGDDDAQTEATTATSSTSSGDGGAGGESATTVGSGGGGGATTSTTTSSTSGTGGSAPVCDPFVVDGTVFGVNNLFVGETKTNGMSDTTAWKTYGANIDGDVSTSQSSGLCMPAGGASASVHDDGNNGIDNSFGKNVLPLLLTAAPDPTAQVNASIAVGEFTIMMHLDGLGADPDQDPVPAYVYSGGQTFSTPNFDGKDCWPVTAESLTDSADIKSAKVTFPMATLVGNTWTSGITDTLVVTLRVSGVNLTLPVHQARISMDLSVDHSSATNGQISGVLSTSEFMDIIQDLAYDAFGFGCNDATVIAIQNEILKASDIMQDGSQDPNATCDGISIGVGFTAVPMDLGTILDPADPPADPCMN